MDKKNLIILIFSIFIIIVLLILILKVATYKTLEKEFEDSNDKVQKTRNQFL